MSDGPRYDPAAERAVLGQVLLSGADRLAAAREVGLRSEHFYEPRHEELFQILERLAAQGRPTDPTIIRTSLSADERHRIADGFLAELMGGASMSAGAVEHHAKVIVDCYALRQLAEAGTRIVQWAASAPVDARREALERSRAALDAVDLPEEAQGRSEPVDILPRVFEVMESGKVSGVSTGIPELDRTLGGGLGIGHSVVIGARPSVGKSMLGVNLAVAACRQGVSTVVFSHEMTSVELYQRILSCVSGVALTTIRLGGATPEQWDRLARANSRILEWPLAIYDESSMTVADYRAYLRRETRRRKLGLVISDYVQLVKPLDPRVPREQQVSQTSAGCKALAKDFQVPMVILAQLSRASEQRKDARPVLSDLRESGSLENDADTVMLLHDIGNNEMEVIVAKNRHGERHNHTLSWRPKQMRAAALSDERLL